MDQTTQKDTSETNWRAICRLVKTLESEKQKTYCLSSERLRALGIHLSYMLFDCDGHIDFGPRFSQLLSQEDFENAFAKEFGEHNEGFSWLPRPDPEWDYVFDHQHSEVWRQELARKLQVNLFRRRWTGPRPTILRLGDTSEPEPAFITQSQWQSSG